MMVIYLLTNRLNGKQYVGQTRRPLEERLNEHQRNRRDALYVDRAIRKHGFNNFSVEIIEVCFTATELNYWEIFWIAELRTKFPNGYNLTDGGEGSTGYITTPELSARLSAMRKGRPVSPAQRAKISAALKGRVFSPEHCAAISAAKMGHSVSSATRAKLSAAGTGKRASAETRAKMSESAATKRAVRCIELDLVFPSMKAALEWLNSSRTDKISRHVLTRACRGERTIDGHHWTYVT